MLFVKNCTYFGSMRWLFMNAIRDQFDFGALYSHRFPLDKLYDAFDVAIKNKTGALKVMLDFGIG